MAKYVSFAASRTEYDLVDRIVQRAIDEGVIPDDPEERKTLSMDLIATHVNGCPLNLLKLSEWPEKFDFAHDIVGIQRHINRRSGKLENCFLPRFAYPSSEEVAA
jgi:hypothetical protein